MVLSFGFAMTFSLMASRDLRNFTFSELVRTLANGYTSQCRYGRSAAPSPPASAGLSK